MLTPPAPCRHAENNFVAGGSVQHDRVVVYVVLTSLAQPSHAAAVISLINAKSTYSARELERALMRPPLRGMREQYSPLTRLCRRKGFPVLLFRSRLVGRFADYAPQPVHERTAPTP